MHFCNENDRKKEGQNKVKTKRSKGERTVSFFLSFFLSFVLSVAAPGNRKSYPFHDLAKKIGTLSWVNMEFSVVQKGSLVTLAFLLVPKVKPLT